jgi:ubiquinone/menaquinone biosynthesis C-methylase UbiE
MHNSIVYGADIHRMFSSIARKYDFLDTLLSFNQDALKEVRYFPD